MLGLESGHVTPRACYNLSLARLHPRCVCSRCLYRSVWGRRLRGGRGARRPGEQGPGLSQPSTSQQTVGPGCKGAACLGPGAAPNSPEGRAAHRAARGQVVLPAVPAPTLPLCLGRESLGALLSPGKWRQPSWKGAHRNPQISSPKVVTRPALDLPIKCRSLVL